MTRVYVVEYRDSGSNATEGVFSSEAKAAEHVAVQNDEYRPCLHIEVWDLDSRAGESVEVLT